MRLRTDLMTMLKNTSALSLNRRTVAALGVAGIVGLSALPLQAQAGADQVRLVNYVARVKVVPENRSDVEVTVTQGPSKLPVPTVRKVDGRVIVDGGIRSDKNFFGFNLTITGGEVEAGGTVSVKGFGQIAIRDLPVIIVRTPMEVRLVSEGTGFGQIGRSDTLELADNANGDWQVGPVAGKVVAAASGAGDIHLATAGDVTLSSSGSGDFTVGDIQSLKSGQAGSGDVTVGRVFGPVELSLAGSGDTRVASVRGDVKVSLAGSGDVRIHEGTAPRLSVSIAGSGDVSFGGTAGDVNVSIAGSGDVSVGKVTGRISKNIIGSGDVRVGQ
jgi:hypothetical protein